MSIIKIKKGGLITRPSFSSQRGGFFMIRDL